MTLFSKVLGHNAEKLRPSLALAPKKQRIALAIDLELPPVILYGQPHELTGSIVLGVLTLEIFPELGPTSGATSGRSSMAELLLPVSSAASNSDVELDSVTLLLVQTMHYTKPFVLPSGTVASCKNCATQKNVLARWDVLLEPALFAVGCHAYPFSHLLPGLLAASTKLGMALSQLFVKYDIVAVAKAGLREVKVVLPLVVLRSILRGPDRNSLRVFPPTDVTASAVLPNVMYPKLTFPIELRMDNVVSSKQDRRWRMRKLSWKLEEHTKVRAATCTKHRQRLKDIEELHRRLQQAKAKSKSAADKNNLNYHHSTVQTLMQVEPPPSHLSRVASAVAAVEATAQHDRDVDEVPEADEGVPNRPIDEAVHFDQDFGLAPNESNSSDLRPMASQPVAGLARLFPDLRPTQTTGARLAPQTPQAPQPDDNTVLYMNESRVVAHGDIKSGWKLDYLGKGRIELVAEISAMECSTGLVRHSPHATLMDARRDDIQEGLRNGANISCDIDDPELGVHVSHVLVVEVIVAEELIHGARPPLRPAVSSSSVGSGVDPAAPEAATLQLQQAALAQQQTLVGVPTGAARVLRMQFKMNVTERSGLGIAWDDEVPPMYEDVRALSPPTYEKLASGTPLFGTPGSVCRLTPAILYGVGETPVVGTGPRQQMSIDEIADLDDRVQEFRL